MGWHFGFKLHLIINDRGELLAFKLTPGNTDDRKPVPEMTEGIFGKLFGGEALKICFCSLKTYRSTLRQSMFSHTSVFDFESELVICTVYLQLFFQQLCGIRPLILGVTPSLFKRYLLFQIRKRAFYPIFTSYCLVLLRAYVLTDFLK